jgi:hypothetical protein
MTKWLLAAAAALVLGALVYWQLGATKVEYVNGLPQYTALQGREYIFERDCYIFKFKHHDSSWPLVGANVPGTPGSIAELPAEVSRKYIGADLPGVRILDVAQVGTRFHIASVRRDTNRHGVRITFEIVFADESARPYPRIDAYWIMDHRPEQRGEAPTILPEYAVPENRS